MRTWALRMPGGPKYVGYRVIGIQIDYQEDVLWVFPKGTGPTKYGFLQVLRTYCERRQQCLENVL